MKEKTANKIAVGMIVIGVIGTVFGLSLRTGWYKRWM